MPFWHSKSVHVYIQQTLYILIHCMYRAWARGEKIYINLILRSLSKIVSHTCTRELVRVNKATEARNNVYSGIDFGN